MKAANLSEINIYFLYSFSLVIFFRIKVGSADIIVLNDYESIKKFLCQKEVLYRPENMVFGDQKNAGMGTVFQLYFASPYDGLQPKLQGRQLRVTGE